MSAWLTVLGMGEDGYDGLSPVARLALSEAAAIYAGPRHLAMLPQQLAASRHPWPSPFSLEPVLARRGRPTCVVASGDPMYFGVGASLARQLPPGEMRVLPVASSLSLAAARLGWALQAVRVVSLLQVEVAAVLADCQPGRRLLVLSAGPDTPAALAACLTTAGYGASRLWVGQRLGGPAETVIESSAAGWVAQQPVDALNLVAVECRLEAGRLAWPPGPGLPDEAYRHDGQLTKQELRAVTLARLGPRPGERLWDVGAGSGSISIEWLRSDPSCQAVAIEADPGRLAMIDHNRRALGVPRLQLVAGTAPQALHGLPAPDVVFIGGGVTAEGVLEACWQALPAGGRLLANAVTLQAEQRLLVWRQHHGGRISRVAVEHAEALGRFDVWRPALPVSLYAVVKP
ncbi:precorrin-6y C5,15-methyltransferase (decarboxylating) subunit CbiE [Frateuria aurantia]